MIQIPRFTQDSLKSVREEISDSLFNFSAREQWGIAQSALLIEELDSFNFNDLATAYENGAKDVNHVLKSVYLDATNAISHNIKSSGSLLQTHFQLGQSTPTKDQNAKMTFAFEMESESAGYGIDGLLKLNKDDLEVALDTIELVSSIGYAPFTPTDCASFCGGLELDLFDELNSAIPNSFSKAKRDQLKEEFRAVILTLPSAKDFELNMGDQDCEERVDSLYESYVEWISMPKNILNKFHPSQLIIKAPVFQIARIKKRLTRVNNKAAREFITKSLDTLERLLVLVGGNKAWKKYTRIAESFHTVSENGNEYSPIESSFLLLLGDEGSFSANIANEFYQYTMETGEVPKVSVDCMCPESRWVAKISYARHLASATIYRMMADLENMETEKAESTHSSNQAA
jgi:hypothetical protein